ncbi:hypothetical protein SLEP1_g10909 [Rubroshorea leprosula]|uniref:Maturase K n=1 Tax=Rubroshorea leprosula TaxID=152421 RepID=A0AAV5IKF5_9ROSI|nr:hypothetical protein SLEP1_g10909 [Rubroshorea leprosula]
MMIFLLNPCPHGKFSDLFLKFEIDCELRIFSVNPT